jgi:rhodanese-related sulfurtransferase
MLFAAVALTGGIAVAGLSLRGEPTRKLTAGVSQRARTVKATELASWIVEGRRDFAVIDMRDQAAFTKSHVRDAVHCGTCHQSKAEGRKAVEETMFVDLSKKLVLVTQTGNETVELPKLLAKNPRLYTLEGGYDAWERDVLAPVTFGGETDVEQVQAKARREALRGFFSGERGTSKPATLPLEPIQRKAAHQNATAREGC